MRKDIPMSWHGPDVGWTIDVEKGMTPTEVQTCVDYALKVQTDRLHDLPPGDKKDECRLTIAHLQMGKVHVNIAGTGERVLLDAYKQQKHYWYQA
jgi:hypothetical protein